MLDHINIKYWELAHGSNIGYHKRDDYSARCDICGDSKTNKNKKRLHLYKKSSYEDDSIKCFNCGYTGNMYSYLRDNHPQLFDSYKKERGIGLINSLKNDILTVRKVQETKTEVYTFQAPSEFIKNDDRAKKYVESRKVSLNEVYYSEGEVTLGDKTVFLKDYIIIPLTDSNGWYGFYSRSLNSKTFYTYIPEKNTGYKIWNWFNISKKSTVYVFEAIFNALSVTFSNVIGSMGSDIPVERLEELDDPVFCLDNDTTGREKSLKYAEKGYKVFVWPDYIKTKDFNDLIKNDGWTKEEVSNLISENTFSGLSAVIKLKLK